MLRVYIRFKVMSGVCESEGLRFRANMAQQHERWGYVGVILAIREKKMEPTIEGFKVEAPPPTCTPPNIDTLVRMNSTIW